MLKTTVSEGQAMPKEKLFSKKRVVRWVATNSTRFVVAGAINAVVPADTKVQKVRRAIGSYIIAELVVEQVRKYVDKEYDDFVTDLKEAKDVVDGIVEGEVVSQTTVVVQQTDDPVDPSDEIVEGVIVEPEPATSTV